VGSPRLIRETSSLRDDRIQTVAPINSGGAGSPAPILNSAERDLIMQNGLRRQTAAEKMQPFVTI
jgi:hypothetical protein